ncbi:diguanylate cyclase [Acinetobacter sp. NCu2D-2]|uniref:GGDEF domain-containing protein n=1 Tax=Acinetobacter sp. NCu2D-2 TaxID=1608473 RepID=UPI0007CDF442|nr:GGDEF domain-containing protein [Acinetobacter sp. NCu2D-2]ANF80844.1 diguanylate cyclase [Acinetobacter sp. NCu2D-2]
MKPTDQTLMQQMQISLLDIERRKQLLGLDETELLALSRVRSIVEPELEHMIAKFYDFQTSVPEINTLIGDADTLARLKVAQHQYILDLFSGCYDSIYVNTRLRIGVVYKRIGVEPQFYLAAMHHLKTHLFDFIKTTITERHLLRQTLNSLEKLFMFDMTLIFETYVWSLMNKVNSSKDKLQEYAMALGVHAQEMEKLSSIDPLTGLLNVRNLMVILNEVLYRSQQQRQPLTVVFIDINDFKKLNDEFGHLYGDEVIQAVAQALKKYAREEDYCFRYGGDEFLVILPNCTEQSAQESFIPRVMSQIEHLKNPVTLSVGVHQTDEKTGYLDGARLIATADNKMYQIKKSQKIGH